jgi:malonyl-CoA/methylmalonyl-CoA synthetase
VLGTALRVCAALPPPAPAAAAAAPPGPAADEAHPRVALMCDPGPEYVAGAMGTWLRGGIAVPLCLSHPDAEVTYVLRDAGVAAVLATAPHVDRMRRLAEPLGAAVHVVSQAPPAPEGPPSSASAAASAAAVDDEASVQQATSAALALLAPAHPALIIYTSGTTGSPKGALHTHASLGAQVSSLCAAWEWAPADRILHALPLHHIHGIVNALLCPLAAGAAVEFLPRFSPTEAWARLRRRHDPVTIFMGVPTMYSFLLNVAEGMPPGERAAAGAAAGRLRLAACGSAACPEPVARRWAALGGAPLLERYGMTETGMLLGNPLRGERRAGTVGVPFPGVEVEVLLAAPSPSGEGADRGSAGGGSSRRAAAGREGEGEGEEGSVGELLVRGAQLFSRYWRRPEATAAAFDPRGFFLTGDTARAEAGGYYRLLGRTSVDVIKRGGFKVSALWVESALAEHPAVGEVAVVGLPDGEYGERVAAVVAPREEGAEAPSAEALRAWAADRLPAYCLPSEVRAVGALPRNAMGKVNKKALREELFLEEHGAAAPPAA